MNLPVSSNGDMCCVFMEDIVFAGGDIISDVLSTSFLFLIILTGETSVSLGLVSASSTSSELSGLVLAISLAATGRKSKRVSATFSSCSFLFVSTCPEKRDMLACKVLTSTALDFFFFFPCTTSKGSGRAFLLIVVALLSPSSSDTGFGGSRSSSCRGRFEPASFPLSRATSRVWLWTPSGMEAPTPNLGVFHVSIYNPPF